MENPARDEPKTPQALLIPELLRRIFELSSDKSNVSHARVCRNWCEEALSVLWSSVDAYSLFTSLAPMTRGLDESELSFSRDLVEGDWARFERYSWRVRSLQFNLHFSTSVFNSIAIGRPQVDFLPNLEELYDPPPSPNEFLLFAQASIKTLKVDQSFNVNDIELLPSRMPHIERLTCIMYNWESPGSSTVSALQKLTSLTHLTISAQYLNVDLFHALGALPNLCSISARKAVVPKKKTSPFAFGTTPPPSAPPSGRAESVASKVFPPESFPSLKEFEVHLPFSMAIEWIQIANRARPLHTLKIHSPHKESAADYMHLTSRIALLCTGLETLELSRDASSGYIPSETSCGIETLTSLKSLTLRAFDARSDSQLGRMLEPLSELETLIITSQQTRTPLHQIALIAHYCRKLSTLELDVDTWQMPSAALPRSIFLGQLRTLHVGFANISETQTTFVANFLSCILPPSCTLEFDPTLPMDVVDTWIEVQKWVAVLIKARLEERGLHSENNYGFVGTRATNAKPRERKSFTRRRGAL